MLKLICATLVVGGLMLTASNASAAEEVMKGKIKKVEKNSLELTVKKETHTIAVNSETQITLNGEKASLKDLKAGNQATVTAEKGDDGTLTATKIAATSKRKKKE